ncbi:hypothetical protein [Rubinisphaera margarita]|uniref:hypothetical protein n=1 Tax=Rubinisphaera margarita TaxID=2909586 RepID=UPI001EE8D32B|nr:hypothetical protein [Rubinisphaera margarita]MCG6157103.1 hypothetical protein [Rubinisphaera margarita]
MATLINRLICESALVYHCIRSGVAYWSRMRRLARDGSQDLIGMVLQGRVPLRRALAVSREYRPEEQASIAADASQWTDEGIIAPQASNATETTPGHQAELPEVSDDGAALLDLYRTLPIIFAKLPEAERPRMLPHVRALCIGNGVMTLDGDADALQDSEQENQTAKYTTDQDEATAGTSGAHTDGDSGDR